MDAPLAVVQRFYALLAAGDSAAALGLLHPDIEWTEAERTPYYTGTMRGIDAVASGLLTPLARDFNDFTTVPREFVAEGDRVVAFGQYSGVAKISGRPMAAPFVHLWTVDNERLRRFDQFTDSAPWNEALGPECILD